MKGSCLCGTVAYEIDQLDLPVVHCHCRSCRKAHAAVFAPTAGVLHNHFRWVKGQDKLTAYTSSAGKQRFFCSVCGSQMIAQREGHPNVLLRVATLDEDPKSDQSLHIWRSHDVAWLEDSPATQSYPEWHPGH